MRRTWRIPPKLCLVLPERRVTIASVKSPQIPTLTPHTLRCDTYAPHPWRLVHTAPDRLNPSTLNPNLSTRLIRTPEPQVTTSCPSPPSLISHSGSPSPNTHCCHRGRLCRFCRHGREYCSDLEEPRFSRSEQRDTFLDLEKRP